MPIWHILHPSNVYQDYEEKERLAKDVTALYTSAGLPAFYVAVYFHVFAPSDIWHGGKCLERRSGDDASDPKPYVYFEITQIAVHIKGLEWSGNWCRRIDQVLKPYTEAKGYDWEYHVTEAPRALWKMNGLYAPPWKSEAEKRWFEENAPAKWQEEDVPVSEE